MTTAKVICDSVAPHGGRLTTLQLRFPRFILAQFNTYGSIAKNARSSRAVPVEKVIKEVEDDPVIPVRWGKREKGMVAAATLGYDAAEWCEAHWLSASARAAAYAKEMASVGAAKEVVNRLLEPFMWVDVVATACFPAWCHYLNQRCAHDAQPEHQELARSIGRAIRGSEPDRIAIGEWHLPYLTYQERDDYDQFDVGSPAWGAAIRRWRWASVRRVRRISYSPFAGDPDTPESDKAKHNESRDAGHWSCFEHQAYAGLDPKFRSGRMTGWIEYRQTFPKQVNPVFDFASLG